jgi:hypothetical protein
VGEGQDLFEGAVAGQDQVAHGQLVASADFYRIGSDQDAERGAVGEAVAIVVVAVVSTHFFFLVVLATRSVVAVS